MYMWTNVRTSVCICSRVQAGIFLRVSRRRMLRMERVREGEEGGRSLLGLGEVGKCGNDMNVERISPTKVCAGRVDGVFANLLGQPAQPTLTLPTFCTLPLSRRLQSSVSQTRVLIQPANAKRCSLDLPLMKPVSGYCSRFWMKLLCFSWRGPLSLSFSLLVVQSILSSFLPLSSSSHVVLSKGSKYLSVLFKYWTDCDV